MEFNVDREYLLESFRRLVYVPSTVGYYVQINPLLAEMAAELGYSVTCDNRNTVYITVDGEDNSKTVMVGAHADTIGFVVRSIENNGWLRVRRVGGICMSSAEGETVTISTRSGKDYTGLMICSSHSVHVFEDCRTLERNEDTMRVLLDEPVATKEEAAALGIRSGDYIYVNPDMEVTANGYLKSRFIDDKAGVACVFAGLKAMKDQGIKPKYRTMFAFPHYEEVGFGGAYVPPEVSEYVALDIGLIGPEHSGHERAVSICSKDGLCTYDYELTSRLMRQAEAAGCGYALDVFFNYSTDAISALRAGMNVRQAAFGMAVYCSHGRERTHIDGLEATVRLLMAYVMDI